MFCSKKIKALKQEIRFQKIDLEGKNNILRVTLNDNRRLRKELNQKNQLCGYYFAENDDEYTAWVLQYKKQIKTEQKLLDSLKKTSWDSYKKLKERENVSI